MTGFEPGILQYYRQEVEELRKSKEVKLARLRAPPGIGHVYPVNGPQIAVRPDGTVELPEEDALPLIRAGWLKYENAALNKP